MEVDAVSMSQHEIRLLPLGMALHKAEVSQALSLVAKRMLPSKRVATASQYILIASRIDVDCSLSIDSYISFIEHRSCRRQTLSPVRHVAAASSVIQD